MGVQDFLTMTNIDMAAPILLTGATGYVAGQLAAKLLAEGHTVRAPVRDPNNAEKTKHLQALADSSPGSIEFSAANLLDEGSYDEAAAGCEVVLHTASPFTLSFDNPQRDLVDPAVNGTRNVLAAATRSETVKRVVTTSSCAAIYGDNADMERIDGSQFTEEHWNTSSSLDHQPYSYSKTLAEQAAWKIAEAQSQWDLLTVNPSLVIGPAIDPNTDSESFNIVSQAVDGTMKFGAADVSFGVVDVRDVAEVHYQAAFTPSASGRHIASGHNAHVMEFIPPLKEAFANTLPLPSRVLPKTLLWLFGPVATKGMLTRKAVSLNVGRKVAFDNSKSINQLGLEYRPLGDSIVDMVQQMIDAGRITPKSK